MGNFLTSPITTKTTDTGQGNALHYGISSMQGWRTEMEDTHVASINPGTFTQDVAIFAVCDGHGGNFVSNLASERLVHTICQCMEKHKLDMNPEQIGASMREACFTLDDEIFKEFRASPNKSNMCGSTAILAILTSTHIIVANLGDSRGVLGKGGRTIPMSFDHKPMNIAERDRIMKAGGMVRNNRVNGDLAVSRGLGDFKYKACANLSPRQQQVSSEADIIIEPIDGSEEFLILACDGIWDVMSNDEICRHVRELLQTGETNMGLIAEEILDTCLKLGSRDNMSLILIQFPGAKIGNGDGITAIRQARADMQEKDEH